MGPGRGCVTWARQCCGGVGGSRLAMGRPIGGHGQDPIDAKPVHVDYFKPPPGACKTITDAGDMVEAQHGQAAQSLIV